MRGQENFKNASAGVPVTSALRIGISSIRWFIVVMAALVDVLAVVSKDKAMNKTCEVYYPKNQKIDAHNFGAQFSLQQDQLCDIILCYFNLCNVRKI